MDSSGATIDFLWSARRDADAAKRLFRKALSDRCHPQPRVINTDLAPIYGSAIPDIKKEGTLRGAADIGRYSTGTTSWNRTIERPSVE
jgi:transposase-like protein